MAQINKSSDYFNTVIWTGNDVSPRTITGVNFQPDFTWTKRRDGGDGNTNHNLYNSVVGAGNNSELSSNGTGAEGDSGASEYGYISAFASDGFTLTDGTDGSYEDLYTNQSGGTYTSWNWKAGGTGVSNTQGSITSTVSANTTSGFSIVSWTANGSNGATIGHGLGATPNIIISKRRSAIGDWLVGGSTVNTIGGGNNKLLLLNSTSAIDTNSEVYQTIGSSTFQVGINAYINTSSSTMISYCFAEKKGFSKFGSYVGNGSTDGTFVYTGFKPAFIMTKSYSGYTGYWTIHDATRNPSNVSSMSALWANASDAESNAYEFDILSNGFKIRSTSATLNQSGAGYIYMAFAENPLVGTNNIPACAR